VLIETRAFRHRNATFGENDSPVANGSEPIGGQVVRSVLRDKNEMGMRHPKTVHDHTHAQRFKLGSKPPTDSLPDEHDSLGQRVIKVRKVVNMLFGNHKALTWSGRTEGHEGHNGVILKDHAGWRSIRHDLAEDALHSLRPLDGLPCIFSSVHDRQ
jgi:hypothetical protein